MQINVTSNTFIDKVIYSEPAYLFKGTNPYFLNCLGKNDQNCFFFSGKVSSGMWELCPKLLGGYDY